LFWIKIFNYFILCLAKIEITKKTYSYLAVLQIIRYSENVVKGIVATLCLITYCSLALPIYLLPVSGQHHGAPPPAASIGDRNISLDFKTLPNFVRTSQDAEMKIGFVDEKAKKV
jgi:hypothetical protein